MSKERELLKTILAYMCAEYLVITEFEMITQIEDTVKEIQELLSQPESLREDLREDLREGISLRDHFAGLAMQGLMAADVRVVWDNESIADLAYDQADAMLERREKKK